MRAHADLDATRFFLRCLTGITFTDLKWHTEGLVSYRIPPGEQHLLVRRSIEAALGCDPHSIEENFNLGRKAWRWKFGTHRELVVYHFMRDRGRADACNEIQLIDRSEYTGKFGPAT